MPLTKKRWWILGLCCLVNLCLGSIYAWSVLAAPMAEHLSAVLERTVTSGDLAIVYTVANSVGPITMITGGWFNDRFGPKKVLFTGGLMFSAGIFLSGFAGGIGWLVWFYGIVSGLGLGMAYGCAVSNCVKLFPDKPGLAGGLTTASQGFGSVVLPPVITAFVAQAGILSTFRWLGLIFLVIICGSAPFLTRCPPDFRPDGWIPTATAQAPDSLDQNWRGMLRSPLFYLMIGLLLCGAFSGMMMISQASALATSLIGASAAAAGVAVSVLAAFNTAGRVAAGVMADRLGYVVTLVVACGLSIAGSAFLCISDGSPVLFYVGISLTGLAFGSLMGVYPGFTAAQFGNRHNSVNYGIMFIGVALAGFFGPTIMRTVYATDGTYIRAFLVAGVLSAVGAVLAWAFYMKIRSRCRYVRTGEDS